jgi:hypothetical protein
MPSPSWRFGLALFNHQIDGAEQHSAFGLIWADGYAIKEGERIVMDHNPIAGCLCDALSLNYGLCEGLHGFLLGGLIGDQDEYQHPDRQRVQYRDPGSHRSEPSPGAPRKTLIHFIVEKLLSLFGGDLHLGCLILGAVLRNEPAFLGLETNTENAVFLGIKDFKYNSHGFSPWS